MNKMNYRAHSWAWTTNLIDIDSREKWKTFSWCKASERSLSDAPAPLMAAARVQCELRSGSSKSLSATLCFDRMRIQSEDIRKCDACEPGAPLAERRPVLTVSGKSETLNSFPETVYLPESLLLKLNPQFFKIRFPRAAPHCGGF